jgi:hypothetical protein
MEKTYEQTRTELQEKLAEFDTHWEQQMAERKAAAAKLESMAKNLMDREFTLDLYKQYTDIGIDLHFVETEIKILAATKF